MNKELLFSLVKVANSLDNMGFYREAKSLDKIAQTIDDALKSLSPGNNVASGDYKTDIEKYKQLAQSGQVDAMNLLLDNVISTYPEDKKNAFLAQSNKIRQIISNQYKKEDYLSDDQIIQLLNNYGINQAKDLSTFNKSWNNMMSNLKNKKFLTENKLAILKVVYRNQAAKFGYNRFGNMNVTGNIETDLDNYVRLISNRLFSEASSLLLQLINSDKYDDKQKQIIKIRADSLFGEYSYRDPKNMNYGGIDRDSLIYNAKEYGVYNARNYQELNNAMARLINFYKKNKFTVDEKNPEAPFMYNYPGAANQIKNFMEEVMIQKGFKRPAQK